MIEKRFVNGSEAHRTMIKAGINMSYPTALKWMLANGSATQPTGRYGALMVDMIKLNAAIRKHMVEVNRQ